MCSPQNINHYKNICSLELIIVKVKVSDFLDFVIVSLFVDDDEVILEELFVMGGSKSVN